MLVKLLIFDNLMKKSNESSIGLSIVISIGKYNTFVR